MHKTLSEPLNNVLYITRPLLQKNIASEAKQRHKLSVQIVSKLHREDFTPAEDEVENYKEPLPKVLMIFHMRFILVYLVTIFDGGLLQNLSNTHMVCIANCGLMEQGVGA